MNDRVARYYEDKTARILTKYGPGPRVHFHTGLHAPPPLPGTSTTLLQRAMAQAQEALLEHLLPRVRRGHLLDAGCGLGGSALFFAERLGARVTAVTNVAEHAEVAATLAGRAGVGSVRPLARDAHDVEGLGPFDAVLAIESSCYFDRARWYAELAKVTAPGAVVHVVDCFAGSSSVAPRFDAYWKTQIGTLSEYDRAARAAGFDPCSAEHLNDAVDGFWALSLAWSEAMLALGSPERERLERSIEEHAWLRGALASRAVEYAWATYRRE